MIGWIVILIALMGVPPLTDAQRAQLDTAVDDSARLDEAALYPLLDSALTWESEDEAGARVPDYDALLADPVTGRGGLFLIEGRFAGRSRRYGLVRSGEWGDALTEWVLVVRDDPQEVAVVYFVDPQDRLAAPLTGSHVRVVGRFYKVWADRDQAGNPARYLTFVARSPSVAAADPAGQAIWLLPMMGVILALAVVYVFVRRIARPSPGAVPPARHGSGPGDDAMLSQDPAEALRQLAEQHRDP